MTTKILYTAISGAEYAAQKLYGAYLRLILLHLGRHAHIAPPLAVKHPEKIWIGEDAEIRHGCGLYGRSKLDIGIKIGARCRIKEHCILDAYSGYIHLGEQVLLGQAGTIHGHGGVEIGNYTLIGAHVCIFSNDHVYREVPKLIQQQGEVWDKTVIGNNVWIGAGAIVLAGVNIGDNSVIGAGSIVTRDIPSNSIAYGNPARVVKQI